MAHNTVKAGFSALVERLNLYPQGATASELLYKILQILFKDNEASLVAALPIKPFTSRRAASIWQMPEAKARDILESLADKGLLVDMAHGKNTLYSLPPPMAGFFEFSLMRVRSDIDQKALSELFFQYLNVEEDFIKDLFTEGETQLGRVFVNEQAISQKSNLMVLDYEKASEVFETASAMAVGMCYCRHKMLHLGRACQAPMDICMTFNVAAESLIRHGNARRIDKKECYDLLQQAYDSNLVQFGENVREKVNFICNCCGCCCEALLAAKKFAILHPVHTTNFLPEIIKDKCVGCGKCVSVCPVDSMSLISADDPDAPTRKVAQVNVETCLGCGLCFKERTRDCIDLKARDKRVITPVNGTHLRVLMAIERGKLQNFIFDNRVLWHHRALAAVLGAILSLPPVKRALANEQIKSRYLAFISERFEKHYYRPADEKR
ncbi:MAG: (Fe-S)-binding protein [Candidatus Riflebacteria bacterium HGW-Riflebacteria-1]|jgi:NAD-dependent dihydropyrimidine dehydrogenase PreA subunit|nr:MAG: (Fe-S)-binding protein [Candidatus Riflebacteria bacterium HGW-Riflebacteria-1]